MKIWDSVYIWFLTSSLSVVIVSVATEISISPEIKSPTIPVHVPFSILWPYWKKCECQRFSNFNKQIWIWNLGLRFTKLSFNLLWVTVLAKIFPIIKKCISRDWWISTINTTPLRPKVFIILKFHEVIEWYIFGHAPDSWWKYTLGAKPKAGRNTQPFNIINRRQLLNIHQSAVSFIGA